MLEKSNKISVLNKMIGLDKKVVEQPYVVPQNSVSNIRQKLGLNEAMSYQAHASMKENIYDLKNPAHALQKCPHCENMAKNFLYLESLIRTNFNKKVQCNLCHSSLKYLQFVNRSIMQVFGNFDSIVQAAKAFSSVPSSMSYKIRKQPSRRILGGKQKSVSTMKIGSRLHQKSTKSLRTLKTLKALKALKTLKTLKTLKALKSAKSLKTVKHDKKHSTVKKQSNKKKLPLGTGGKNKATKSHNNLKKKQQTLKRSVSKFGSRFGSIRNIQKARNVRKVRSSINKPKGLKRGPLLAMGMLKKKGSKQKRKH